ncbi:MAG: hypothetical protein JOZ42_12375 [Acetobacteraceae bacterium]|nr:hypothetical protein [Acetobacteraceae bacterium]
MKTRNASLGAAVFAALLAVSGGSAPLTGAGQFAQAEPKGDAARPARGPASEATVPTAAPAATPGQTTGAINQGPKVKEQNQAEKNKTETEGK